MGLEIPVGKSQELGALENRRGERPGFGGREEEIDPSYVGFQWMTSQRMEWYWRFARRCLGPGAGRCMYNTLAR